MVIGGCMSGLLSPAEFLVHPAARERAELVRGHVRMMTPASNVHGVVSANTLFLLAEHVRKYRLGLCFADSTGYALPNLANTVRAPDASFIRADRLPAGGVSGGFHQIAPDLAVEVLSPSESEAELAEKVSDYLVAGTAVIWVVDPTRRTVAVIPRGTSSRILEADDLLTGGEILPGFACVVGELFHGLAPITHD